MSIKKTSVVTRTRVTVLVITLLLAALASVPASAQSLGTAQGFGVLAGSAVTNTGTTTVNGDVGVFPGTSITGFPPGIATGAIRSADAVAQQAQSDLTAAYNDAALATCSDNRTGEDLGGDTLTPGVYCFDTSAFLTGTLTLDFQGNPDALFIFQTGSTLTTASGSSVAIINAGGETCPPNVFWQLGSSATLGTSTTFVGNILALTSITMNTGTVLNGRALARNGAVTLASNTIAACGPLAPCPVITVTPAILPAATVGVPYSADVNATGGTPPHTFAVSSGALPTGLVLNSTTGAITGTPTTEGTFDYTITATEVASGCTGSRAYRTILGADSISAVPTLDFLGFGILAALLAIGGLFVMNRQS